MLTSGSTDKPAGLGPSAFHAKQEDCEPCAPADGPPEHGAARWADSSEDAATRAAEVADRISRADQRTDRQTVLVAELHHRIQNTLAIVLALSRLTARSVSTLDEFQVAFSKRIQAMARTNALLLQRNVETVDVQTALEVELEAYLDNEGQVALECEPLHVSAEAALNLSLIFHELTINSVKYGALSSPAGRLHVACRRQGVLGVLQWIETTPDLTVRPVREGSGSLLIKRLTSAVGGAYRMHISSSGLHAELDFPLNPD